jgi:hypothetical protein
VKVRLRVQELDKPQLVAYDRILKRYGQSCYPQEIEDRADHWKVPIGAYFQSKIVDEKTEREKLFTLNFQNVGEILVRKSTMRVLHATPLRTLGKNISEKKSHIRKIVEQDLIKILGQKEMQIRFSQLRFAFQGLQPIYRTITRLLLEEYPSYEDLREIGTHYPEQVDLLIEIGYAEYTAGDSRKLVATNKLKELYSQERNIDTTIDAIFGLVLSRFYYDLQKVRRIAQFIPYIRTSTAYYGDAVQFGSLIRIKEQRLRENVRRYYRGVPSPPRLRYAYPTLIRELVDAKILNYDNEYITGREGIFDKLMDVRSDLNLSERSLVFG